jgi:hypothetical protein
MNIIEVTKIEIPVVNSIKFTFVYLLLCSCTEPKNDLIWLIEVDDCYFNKRQIRRLIIAMYSQFMFLH